MLVAGLKPQWVVIEADRNGRPIVSEWRLPRLAFPGLVVSRERGKYVVLRAVWKSAPGVRSGKALAPTGFVARTLRELSSLLETIRPKDAFVSAKPVTLLGGAVVDAAPLPSDNGLVEAAAHLFMHGSLLGSRVSAGHYTPAVPSEFSWCVLNVQGSPLALCRDAIEALIRFRWFEAMSAEDFREWEDLFAASPDLQPTDEEIETQRFEDRRFDLGFGRAA